jgi:hypothetical protein
MALTTVDQILVKRASMTAARNVGGAVALALKAFWMGRNQEGQTGKLYLLPFGALTADAVGVDAACKVHFIYVKKDSSATDVWYKVFDDATDDSTAADAVIAMGLTGASDEQFFYSKLGVDLGTGLDHGSYTAFLGYNATTAGVALSGFVIVGDA